MLAEAKVASANVSRSDQEVSRVNLGSQRHTEFRPIDILSIPHQDLLCFHLSIKLNPRPLLNLDVEDKLLIKLLILSNQQLQPPILISQILLYKHVIVILSLDLHLELLLLLLHALNLTPSSVDGVLPLPHLLLDL